MYCEKVFEKLYKTIKESVSSNVTDLFYLKSTQRALGHPKGTRELLKEHLSIGTVLLGHYKGTQGTRALKYLRLSGTLRYFGTWALKALGHSGT